MDTMSNNVITVIDEAALQRRYSGRKQMIDKLVGTFLRSHVDTANEIRSAIASNDLEFLRNTAHSIKGLSGYLEATELLRISEHAQMATERNDPDALSSCEQLADALDRVIVALRSRSE